MPLINTSVPNLIQGVSQQSDATRFSGQCELQENALSSVVDGLKKRPCTRYLAKLMDHALHTDSFVHFIDRDDEEKYVVIHDRNFVQVFNLVSGIESKITCDCGTVYASFLPVGALPKTKYSYLNTVTPRERLKALTVSDSTFIVNTSKTIEEDPIKSSPLAKDFLVFVKQGDYNKPYGFDITRTVGVTETIQQATAQLKITGSSFPETGTDYGYTASISSIDNGGLGFVVGEVIDLHAYLPNSISVDYCEDDCSPSYPAYEYYGTGYKEVVGTRLQVTVASVNANGTIQSLNAPTGNFRYRRYNSNGSVDWTFGFHRSDGGGGGFFRGGGTRTAAGIESAAGPPASVSTETTTQQSIDVSATSGNATQVNGSDSKDAAQNASTLKILQQVKAAAVADTDFNAAFTVNDSKITSNLLVCTADAATIDFNVSPIDGLGGNGIGVIHREVASISELPTVAKNGFQVKIAGDAELNEDDYYVKFETDSGDILGVGSWVECVAPDTKLRYDSTTVPMELRSDPDFPTDFLISPMAFADRMAGDDDSNPFASFLDNEISNLFFFKNRLGFLSRENVILSESGLGVPLTNGQLEFNFGRTTVTSLIDSDPIDISVSSPRVTFLRAGVGFQENLILFADNGQFVLKGRDTLTPTTVSVSPITNFNYESQVDPLALGSYIYFPFSRGAHSGIQEFTVNATTDTYDSVEITEQAPAYIPKNIIKMVGTTSEDVIAVLSKEETGSLYIYKYFWNNRQKILSSWSKFTFTGSVRGMEFIDSDLYVVRSVSGQTILDRLPFEEGQSEDRVNSATDAGFNVFLDCRIPVKIEAGTKVLKCYKPDGTYSGAKADRPYQLVLGQNYYMFISDQLELVDFAEVKNAASASSTLELQTADAPSSDVYGWFGLPYSTKYKFSTQVFKGGSGNSASPSSASDMHLRNGTLFFDTTSEFNVVVTPFGRPSATESFTAIDRPSATSPLSNSVKKFSDGFFRFPIYSEAKNVGIQIENNSGLESKFSSAEFESFVKPRSQRYG